MARIRPDLLARIMDDGDYSRPAAYRWITKKANELVVDNDVAALALAQELGIPLNKYSTPEQREALRGAKGGHPTRAHAPSVAAQPTRTPTRGKKARRVSKEIANTVFVVHGRDSKVNSSMFQLLSALGLHPIEWDEAVGYTRDAAPHISKVLQEAFKRAAAAVVVFTPDDEARLRPHFHNDNDEAFDTEFRGQARPNVLFEAGIALALRPGKTVLVEVGKVRPFTDIGGMHRARLSANPASRNSFVQKLRNAGLTPNTSGSNWLSVGEFTPSEPEPEAPSSKRRRR